MMDLDLLTSIKNVINKDQLLLLSKAVLENYLEAILLNLGNLGISYNLKMKIEDA